MTAFHRALARAAVALGAAAALPALATAQGVPAAISLGDAARLAASQSPAAIAAKERAYQQGARAVQTRADLLPSLSTSSLINGGSNSMPFGSTGGTGTPIPFGYSDRTVDMQVKATQTLVDLGALRRWKASGAETDVAASSARSAAESAAQDGALAYVRVLRADARLEARLADSVLAVELLDIARQQLAAGTAIALDVTRAESQLASAVSQLITGRNEVGLARLELVRTLGLPVDARPHLRDSLRDPAPEDAAVTEADAVRTAFMRRGDILGAVAAIDAAQRRTGAIRAERLPSISLFGSAMSTNEGAFDYKSYGVQVTVPVFDGFRREARIAEGRAREREAEAQARDVRLRTEVDVRSAMLDLGAARERVAAARVELRLAEQEVAQAKERFKAGVAGNADVINASLTLNGARDRVVDARSAYHGARVQLAAAQGLTVTMK
jgi:outer membrane protein